MEQIRRGHPIIDRKAVDDLLARFDSLPVADHRSEDDILGYDESRLPA